MKNKSNATKIGGPLLNFKGWAIGWQKACTFHLYLPQADWEFCLYDWMLTLGKIYIIKWRK